MHYKTKDAAVAKYTPLFMDGGTVEQLRAAISCDEKKFSDADIDEIISTIISDPPALAGEGNAPAKSSKMDWYDEFQVRIQKREVRNPLLRKMETIITGWELVKKLHPKLIEPHLAKSLNIFADSFDVNGAGLYLVEKDTMRTGDVIAYKTWAEQMGKNPEEDINILLKPKDL